MITLLAGVQLVNLTSCYNISSKIQHIAATSQIIVSLASTGNTACEILPDGLSVTYEDSANLSFTQDISNFIYVNTTSIILSIPAGKVFSSDIITARVIMTSYAEFTEIEIGAFEDLKLQLQNCFNILPVVTIFEQSFSAALVSTGFCADIIKDSQILKVRITFGGQEFTRLLKDFIGFDYATGQTNLLLSEMNIDQSVLIQPFLSGMIQFILKSGSSLIIDFQDIIVGPRNVEVFNYVRVLAVSGAVTFQNNMNQTYQRIYFEQMVQKKYNRVSYKITVKTSNNTVYQFSRDYGKYDLQPSQAIRISCKVTQTIGPEECIDLTVKMATTETLQYEGFIIFYQDFTILGMIKATNLKSSLACSSSGQLIVKSGQFCVRLPPSSNLDTCLFTTSYPVTYKVWVTNFGAAESYPGKFERNITYNVNTVPEVCMTCDDLIENVLGWTCQQYIDWSLDGHAVLVNITTRGASPAGTKSYSTVFLDQIVNSNYLIVLIIVFVIGGIYLVFVIVYSIGGMVVFQIQLKKRLKKKKVILLYGNLFKPNCIYIMKEIDFVDYFTKLRSKNKLRLNTLQFSDEQTIFRQNQQQKPQLYKTQNLSLSLYDNNNFDRTISYDIFCKDTDLPKIPSSRLKSAHKSQLSATLKQQKPPNSPVSFFVKTISEQKNEQPLRQCVNTINLKLLKTQRLQVLQKYFE